MAEAVVSGIAGEIVSFLGRRALKNVGKLWGVKDELKTLEAIVSKLQLVLDDAEEQYHQDPLVRNWVEDLKDAFYEARDMLEEFNIEALRRELRGHNEISREVRTIFSSSNQLVLNLKMSNKVRAVREKIEAIGAGNKDFHLKERPVGPRVERQGRKREETHSYISQEDVKGRDDDKKAVKKFLLDYDVQENVSVLPIVGIGGLGKTTLAQYVYNDEMVSKHFQLKMWVCVSDDFDKEKIVKSMIVCAKNKDPPAITMELLQKELREEIDGKRYLLVLDDWWNEEKEAWLGLRTLLLGCARGSKILITTRSHSVGKITGTTSPHLLGGLCENAALDLLLQMACRKKVEMQDPDLRVISEEIVEKCSGVPLVIRAVGILLSSKESNLEWSRFKDERLPEVIKSEEKIKSVLQLSYNHLPSHLKQCFAFCSLFPKDYKIKIRTLVDLWVSGGLVQPSKTTQHLEDIGREYFMDLLWGNFFQDFKKDPNTNEETCKMHDLMHDLACSVAGLECLVAWDNTVPVHEKTRHISIGNLPIPQSKESPLRTFLSVKPQDRSEADLRQLIKSFTRLHILDLHASCIEKVPRSIGKLKYLTYLDFSKNGKLKRLPNSITRLSNLQTLNLCGCRSLEKLPRDIRKLVSLRNLNIDGCQMLSYMPQGLGQLTSLHRLTRFILPKDKAHAKNCCRLGELKGLNHIRGSLRIENLGSMTDAIAESKEANLEGKQSLETLKLIWGDLDTGDVNIEKAMLDGLKPHPNLQKLIIGGYKGDSFPRWVTALPNLVELQLWQCTELDSSNDGGGNVISNFHDGLKSLRSVEFYHLPKLASLPRWLLQANNLQVLKIYECDNLKELPEQIEALRSLQVLLIHGAASLTSLPEGIGRLASLTSLYILDCEELDSSKDESGDVISDSHDGLKNLCAVDFSRLPKLASLPRWLPQASNLESLKILCCGNLKELPEQIEALQSLQRLHISDCPSLTSLPEGMRRLVSLTNLRISHCAELDSTKDESGSNISDFHDGLNSLRSVKFYYLPKLASLPRWLLQANNLQHLEISDCESLRELPERIEALQDLYICNCPSLTSLPKGIRALASLTSINITRCAELDLSKDESSDVISDFHGLKSLCSVRFEGLPKLASLPRWLLQANNLQDLKISSCENLKELPEWIEAFQSLQELHINHCPLLTSLPEGMRRLTSLASLRISGCVELDLSKDESGNIISDFHGFNSLRSVGFERLPKLASLPRWLLQANNLQDLKISGCENLKELPKRIEAFQSLRKLDINHCPLLTSLPEGMRRLTSLASLRISGCVELDLSKDESGNIISDFHGFNSLRSVSFSGLPKLASPPRWLLQANNLQVLKISSCENLEELPERIEAFQSLQELHIIHCPLLTSLPKGMRRLTSLASLRISGCVELDLSKDESGNIISDFHGFKSLRSVRFERLPKLASLPRWLLQANNLQDLSISGCENLKELPKRIEAFQSLQELHINHCPLLTSLPEGMRRLTSLAFLRILGCPKLEERCKRDAGEDWHKIAHIAHISYQV